MTSHDGTAWRHLRSLGKNADKEGTTREGASTLRCFSELGDAFSVYLLDTHDGNSADDRADILAGSIIPYEEELINMHGRYNKYTGTNIYHIKG